LSCQNVLGQEDLGVDNWSWRSTCNGHLSEWQGKHPGYEQTVIQEITFKIQISDFRMFCAFFHCSMKFFPTEP
jgi:hypothetical protein